MKLIAPVESSKCRTFLVGSGPSDLGPRLGGHAPDLTPWPGLHPEAEYFVTLPLQSEPDVFFSVFRNCGPDAIWDAMNEGLRSDSAVLLIAHPEVRRRTDNKAASVLSEHPLVLGKIDDDLMDSEDPEVGMLIRSGSKIGGMPYCVQEPELEGAKQLFENGYIQIAQIDAVNPGNALVSGNWPFADGVLNLFWKPPWSGVVPRWSFQK